MFAANRVAKIKEGAGLFPDLNLDRNLDGEDIAIFVQVLLGQDSDPMRGIIADINTDGTTNTGDIAPFVAMLVGP